ncbi:uncharacterized protein BCR38DRAFT_432775 [Pseudomassariella vexata]|uniref:Polyketide synthase n=1 Tax=Pseudomassariella vexata TaxID=1141098 RepID=A0A1Y2E287_9PEZI|nr:uncharacterized protein BCR38DRAFT_432775 [Pseudomassariella vexata]ORY65436.1 hypothetical protein BCR38DRAFT_432775 [Pseudomassariella vexata]
MSASTKYYLLFGGQGSTTVFSHSASAAAEEDAHSASAGSILLSRCHVAFLQEIASLDARSQDVLAIDLGLFPLPRDLLKPVAQYHTHAVLQATTIYLCQVLHYLAEIHRVDGRFEDFFDHVRETAGFSSGLLPAVVAARSHSLDEFITTAVEVFRLAFWIAFRTLFRDINTNTSLATDGDMASQATSSLVIRGLSPSQVEERLKQHFTTQELGQFSQKPLRRLQISAISSSSVVSVSGPGVELSAFRKQAVPDLTTTFAHIHGWYHGGDQLEDVVKEVLEDLRRRAISFPKCSGPTKPIRSTVDGTLFDTSDADASNLLEWIVRHLLVYCVNWSDTSLQIAVDVRGLLVREPATVVKLLSFGPSSGSLFPDFQTLDPRIQLLDLSSFKTNNKSRLPYEHRDSIAIVGMSVNLPKGKGTSELWETLSQGLNAVQEIPESRFKVSEYYSEDSHKPRSMPTRHGAFLGDPFSFDNAFFNISPREAKSMDPQQRILLHAAQEAFEDAGYVADSSPSFQRASMGCYIGLATGDYTDNLRNDIDVFYSPGTLRAFHSGRISYFYRLSGPSIVTDTACSSSMVSVYQACRALQHGDCTATIAGGVNVISSPDMYLGLARGHFLSSTGGCKPFDAAADGYCRAEGCVLFVLKRLSDAIAENDRIHGVIRNIMINQSGNAHSITHPHSQTQIDLFQRLLQQTNVDPGSVGVIEAHGTGTQAGDAREIESLRTIFGPHHFTAANPLVVSSIKGNIGHCEAASGAAGLAKLLLMLREKKIPIQVGFKDINPCFTDLESSSFVIPRRTTTWNHSQRSPRRAMLNNFGAAGSNTSLLLEEWVEPPVTQPRNRERSAFIFASSAKSQITLRAAVHQYLQFLEKAERRPSLKDICYTATARRQVYDHRISMVCTSINDLRTKLEHVKAINSVPARTVSATIFVFSGQGGLYQGMGNDFMYTFPAFREDVMTCEGILQGLGYPSMLSILCRDQGDAMALDSAELIIASQCACMALEYALAKMFMSWGILPNYIMGHSLGEYAALCISGALSLEDALRVVATRAKLMSENCLPGTSGMLACNLSPEKAEELILENQNTSQLTVTCLNGISDCVVGGLLDQISLFQKECKRRKVKSKLLDVPYAFHSPAMDPILQPLQELGRSIKFKRPTIPVISNVFGRIFEEDDFSSDYFALHARQPVHFSEGLMSLQSRELLDDSVFLEIGPQPTTIPMLRSSIYSQSCTYLNTLQKGQDAWASISSTLAAISLRKIPVNWREVFTGTSAKMTSLPGHLLEGSSFMIPYQEPLQVFSLPGQNMTNPRTKTGFGLLPWLKTQASSDEEFVLETTLAILGPLISGHNVGGSPICPASVFHELAIEATQTILEPLERQVLVVSEMNFASPLIYVISHKTDVVTVYITRNDSTSSADFKITSCSAQDQKETLHCTGRVAIQNFWTTPSHWMKDAAIVARQSHYFSGAGRNHINTFRTKVLYEAIFTRVVRYSLEYQTLVYLNVADSNLEGIGEFKLPSSSQTEYLAHPVFTDTLLHAAGFIANLAVRSDEVGICARVESIEISYRDIDYTGSFTVYCSLLEIKGIILADATALDSSGKVVAVVRGMEFKRLRLSAFQHMLSLKSIALEPREDPLEQAKPQLVTGLITPPITGDDMNSLIEAPGSLLHDVSQALKGIVMDVGGFSEQDMDYTKSLDELGIDSLVQIEIISKVTCTFPGQAGLDHHALSECETLESLENKLSSILQSSMEIAALTGPPVSTSQQDSRQPTLIPSYYSPSDSVQKSPVTLHISQGTEAPLCLFHDGSGQVSMYARLRDHDRSTYAFSDPHFGSDKRPHCSINQMAKSYVSLLTKSSFSPLIVGGWSFGGVVAFEAAQQLMAEGFEVKGLVLIDSPNPDDHKPLPNEVIANILKPSGQTLALNSHTALKEEFQFNASMLGNYKAVPLSKTNKPKLKTVMLRSQDIFDTEKLCGVRYDWLSNQDTRDAAIVAWEALVGGHAETLPIPGNHFEPFSESNINETGAQLWKACRYIEDWSEF